MAIRKYKPTTPGRRGSSVSDFADQIRVGLNAVVGMVAGLLLMSVVVAVVGIVLTLYLAVHERTRETGMLRAVGMTRRQVRRMIRFESVMIAVFGTLLGMAACATARWSGWPTAPGPRRFPSSPTTASRVARP